MSGDRSRAEYGKVEFTLYDKEVVLKPSWKALEQINAHFGSLSAAISQCAAMDFTGVHAVIVAGIGTTSTGGREELKEKIFDHGLPRVATEAVKFLRYLSNPTGRNYEDNEDDEGSGKS